MDGRQEILNWTGGAFVHNHFRIDDLISRLGEEDITPEMKTYMQRYKDGSFTLDAITTYLQSILGQPMLITDTQHPSYVLDDNYDDFEDADKIKFFNPNAREKTVDLLTQCIVERMRVIRSFRHLQHVFSGVEADILDGKGGLTVTNEGLAQLDYVTASFHSSIWYAAGHESPKAKDCIDMYHYIVDNPHVDTISHPTYYIPDDVKVSMTPQDWVELFQNMKSHGVAYEINLDSTNLITDPNDNLDRSLIVQALKIGVPLIIGFDFHYLSDWGVLPSLNLVYDDQVRSLLQEHMTNGTLNILLNRVLSNLLVLRQIGLQPHNIVNSTEESFRNWMSTRES